MSAAVDNDRLSRRLILNDDHRVLKVKINPEVLWVQVNSPQLASLIGDLLPLHLLKEVKMVRVQLHNVHLLEYLIHDLLVVVGQQEPMHVDMLVELLDSLGLVLLERFVR